MTIGKNIRRLRRALDLTQEQLGKKVGVGKSTICEIEKDRKNPSLYVAIRIAATLKTTVNELI